MELEKTFESDDLLPDLPLPNLSETLKRYLDSVKPHVNEEEFLETKKIVNQFEKNEGSALHQRLVNRTRNHRNWASISIVNILTLHILFKSKWKKLVYVQLLLFNTA